MSRTEMPLIIKEHTGATYTFAAGDWGAIHTNRGNAGNIAYTLPTLTTADAGVYLHTFNAAAGEVSVSCTNLIIADNDIAATSVTWSEATEIVGWGARFLWTGTKWLYTPFIPSLEATQAIA